MPGSTTLVFDTNDMEFGAEEVLKILNAYQSEIDSITTLVENTMSECSGEIYEAFKSAYNTKFLPILNEGSENIKKQAETLGIDAEILADATKNVKKIIG